jgi:hypothetical protein
MTFNRGDYVLATKWDSGDPKDHFVVGFFSGMLIDVAGRKTDRFMIVDSHGVSFRANGFRRIAKITPECGNWIISHLEEIEQGDRNLWSIKRFWKRLVLLENQ